jgi:hypothetical protein
MALRITIISIFALCFTVSCTSKDRREPDFDKDVMEDIFPSLLDSMYVEITFSMTPPRITEVVDSLTGKKALKAVEKGTTERELIRNDLNSFERDSNYTIIVLRDSMHALSKEELQIFRSKYSFSKAPLVIHIFKKVTYFP